jgi:uncharacterized protein involved in exopolysaccharide biosynthesis
LNEISRTDNHTSPDEEVSLVDILNFFADSWQTVLVFSLFGLGLAGTFLFFTPKQYEAIAQIRMAQITNPNDNNNNNNINFLGVNIEEPAALMARMTLPTAFDAQTIQECGLADREDAGSELAKSIKLSIPNGIASAVNLKIRATSPELAKRCANALYQFIKSSQSQLIAPYIEHAKSNLTMEQERLARATQIIARADKSGAAVSAVYLATRDEIRYLLDQITNLQNIIQNESRVSHLTAPIYVNNGPVFPSKGHSLLAGVAIGGFLGLLIALVRNLYRSNQTFFK